MELLYDVDYNFWATIAINGSLIIKNPATQHTEIIV